MAVALSLGLVAGMLTLGASRAAADVMSFDLTVPNSGISAYPGPYAHVMITQSGGTATVNVASATTGGYTYLFGDGGSFDLNTNGSASASGFSFTGPGTPGPCCTVGSGNVDGFGIFNLTLDSFDGFTAALNTLSFTLTKASGTWSSASDVLVANASGAVAAAHIFVSGASCGDGACATGFAADSGASVPEPGTLALLGTGLVSAGVMVRKQFFSGGAEAV